MSTIDQRDTDNEKDATEETPETKRKRPTLTRRGLCLGLGGAAALSPWAA